jgi:hypothetical protein
MGNEIMALGALSQDRTQPDSKILSLVAELQNNKLF